jgi:hypothetical protein
MSFQWVDRHDCTIMDIDDFRAESGRCAELTALMPLTGPMLGLYNVSGHPERLIGLRGYSGIEERRQALGGVLARRDWPEVRRSQADLARERSVHVVRAISPQSGPRPGAVADSQATLLLSDLRFPEQIGPYHLWLRLFLRKEGLDPIASFATLEIENDIPALPVVRHRTEHIALLPPTEEMPALPAELRNMLRSAPQALRLEPVAHG